MLVAFVIGNDKIGRYLGEFGEHEMHLLQKQADNRERKIFVWSMHGRGTRKTFTLTPKNMLTKKAKSGKMQSKRKSRRSNDAKRQHRNRHRD